MRPLVGAAISISMLHTIPSLIDAGADFLVIESAHADHLRVLQMIEKVKARTSLDLLVGNIVTGGAARRLVDAGANGVKVGLGGGSSCTTSWVTGVGSPLLSAVAEVADALAGLDVTVVADGGIRSSGDIVKALAAGADVACIGNLFARAEEAPGRTELRDGQPFKEFVATPYSSLELRAPTGNTIVDEFLLRSANRAPRVEGVAGYVPVIGPLHFIGMMLKQGISGGFGFLGASSIQALQEHASFVRLTPNGMRAAMPHSLIAPHADWSDSW
jgi:IMP dehydrogenase